MEVKLINILSEQFGVPVSNINLQTDIFKDLGADSLDIVETQIALENEFDIEINREDYENKTTVQELLDMVAKKLETV